MEGCIATCRDGESEAGFSQRALCHPGELFRGKDQPHRVSHTGPSICLCHRSLAWGSSRACTLGIYFYLSTPPQSLIGSWPHWAQDWGRKGERDPGGPRGPKGVGSVWQMSRRDCGAQTGQPGVGGAVSRALRPADTGQPVWQHEQAGQGWAAGVAAT